MAESITNSKSFFHGFIESLPHGVMIISLGGRILDFNRNLAFMLTLNGIEPGKTRYQEILTPRLKSFLDELVAQIVEEGYSMERQIAVSVADEVEVMMALSGSILLDDKGERNAITVICREMSARQELDRMRELESFKSDFISSITHDLKAPLTSIVGYADLLNRISKEKLSPKEVEFLGIIQREGLHLSRMIDDIVNVRTIESGNLQLKAELTTLGEIAEEVVKIANTKPDKYRFSLELAQKIPPLWIDKELMTRVIMNLVSNAVKYSPDGGDIRVAGYLKEGNVHLEVTDCGMGMSDEALAKLFSKFFRVKNTATKGIGGTGLGLVITRGIVEAHGGTVAAASVLGEGSTFSVILPLRLGTHRPGT